MATTRGFIFDYVKCVGCHACLVACFNENKTNPALSWRQVNHYNKEKLPLLGFVHQSIACNHCAKAPCLNACPSNAYSFDADTGAVVHTKNLCIGCKYCTWACPFDAPKYNSQNGIIEKCHFCFHRLKEGDIPSCALNCPTGALSFGEIEELPQVVSPGFSQKRIFPRIKVLGSDVINSIPEMDLEASGIDSNVLKQIPINKTDRTINPLHELPLALFTFISAFIVGWTSSALAKDSIQINFWLFLGLGATAMLLSTLHLGKPFRAHLSVRNLKSSWLSREILMFGAFMVVGLFTLFFNNTALHIISSVVGLLFLFSVEMVYSITVKRYRTPIHSANIILTAATFFALFSQLWSVLLVLLAIKTMLFTIRNGTTYMGPKPAEALVSFLRLVIGFLIPFGFLAFTQMQFSWMFATLIIAGELVDRIMYYGDFEPERPMR